jgi:hypothetical protein
MSHKTLFAGGRRVTSVQMPVNLQKIPVAVVSPKGLKSRRTDPNTKSMLPAGFVEPSPVREHAINGGWSNPIPHVAGKLIKSAQHSGAASGHAAVEKEMKRYLRASGA